MPGAVQFIVRCPVRDPIGQSGAVTVAAEVRATNAIGVVAAGASVGVLGGLIGLGGAEFRLPLLIGVFAFGALSAVILNKAMSLIVVITALPIRLAVIPFDELSPHWNVAVNLLAGSLLGAWMGATAATRMRSVALYRVLAVLLVLIAVVLVASHLGTLDDLGLNGLVQVVAGVVAGFLIGLAASVMGVAGGELLIPTIVLLYGIDVKTAGSLSLMVSLPTMIAAFARYSRDGSFVVLRNQRWFMILMAVGSVVGTIIGGLLAGVIPEGVLIPLLGGLLVLSAVSVWRHATPSRPN
jgi:uncharacterized membrane protein YfcA